MGIQLPRPALHASDLVTHPSYYPILRALGYEPFSALPTERPQALTFAQIRAHLEGRRVELRRQEVFKRLRRLQREGLVEELRSGRGRTKWRLTRVAMRATDLAIRDRHLEWLSALGDGQQGVWSYLGELVVYGIPHHLLPPQVWTQEAVGERWGRILLAVNRLLAAAEELVDAFYEKDPGYREALRQAVVLGERLEELERKAEERHGVPTWDSEPALEVLARRDEVPVETFLRIREELDANEEYRLLESKLWRAHSELRKRALGISLLPRITRGLVLSDKARAWQREMSQPGSSSTVQLDAGAPPTREREEPD